MVPRHRTAAHAPLRPVIVLGLALAGIAALGATRAGAQGPTDPYAALEAAAQASFEGMPDLEFAADIGMVCGGGVTAEAVYCTTEARIWMTQATGGRIEGLYLAAHLFGHAAQVTQGVADVALAAIRAEPERESALRRMVELQVDCLAGVFLARAHLGRFDPAALNGADPLARAHWGRNPVREGPAVPVDVDARAAAFDRGFEAADPAACASGEFSADLLVAADRF